MTHPLTFRLKICSICLICLDCKNLYGQNCTCQSREIEWKKKKIERDYTVDFCHKPLTQKGATKQKVALEIEFLNWFFANASPHIKLSPTPTIKDKQLTQNETAKITNLINLEDNVSSVKSNRYHMLI
ncbi:uncharacterized protein OCT59_028462 [Rhizophagus irregularis]|uniref:uncharacterized protein n=1 Tax=Rhizophagus irregularis TaxID=588596 RepID=UPI0033348233|nr:hypothetical protein OCT59_028462 [Rhizophagus irregularis]